MRTVVARGVAFFGLVGLAVACGAQTRPAATRPATQPRVLPTTTVPSPRPATEPSGPLPRVVLEIGRGDEDWGRIVVELSVDKVPITVENFLQYVDDGFYDGTIFHRVIPGFLVQGGGYTSLTEVKKTGLRHPIRCESRNGLKNLRGTLAMARTRNPASATSQFFINLEDNPNLDYPSRDGWGYCAFGTVVEGMEVVERIRDVPTRTNAAVNVDRSPSQPVDPPVIRRAYRLGGSPSPREALLSPFEPGPDEQHRTELEGRVREATPEEMPDAESPPEPDAGEPAPE